MKLIFLCFPYFNVDSFIVPGLWMNRLPHFLGKSWISFHTKSGSYLEDYTPLHVDGNWLTRYMDDMWMRSG